MITCALSDKQLRSLRVKVAGDLLDLVKPENKENFNLKDYLKAIYDIVNANTKNQNSAIDYARMAGVFIKQVYGRDQRLTPLRKKGYSNDEVDDYTIAASDPKKGFDYVAEFLGVNTNPSQDLAEVKQALTLDQQMQAVREAIVRRNSNTVYGETLKPNSAITTSIQELIDGNLEKGQDPRMIFYTKFTKNILDKVYSSGKEDLAGIPYEGVAGGLHISLIKYRELDIEDTYPHVKDVLMSGMEKDYIIEDYNNAFVYVITDKDGNIVRFNEDYKVADDGKPVYYNSRYLPQKNSDGTFNVKNVTNTQTPEEIAKGLNITVEEATAKLNAEFQMLEAAYKYINETAGNRITYFIMGGSYGAPITSNNKSVPFNSVNLENSTLTFKFLAKDTVFKGSSAGIYMTTDKSSASSLIFNGKISEEIVDNIITLLTENVVDSSGKAISNETKVKLIGTYVLNSIKDFAYSVDKSTGAISIRYQGEKIKLGDKAKAKELLKEALLKDKSGYPRQLVFNTNKANSNEKVTLFTITPGAKPVVNTTEVPYLDYLKEYATIVTNLAKDGTIAQYNPYFALAPIMAQALKVIAPAAVAPKTPVTKTTTDAKAEIERLSNKKLSSAQGEINTGKLEEAVLPNEVVEESIAQDKDGNWIEVYINNPKLQGVILARNGNYLFRAMQGRFFVIAKVGNFYLPFYISSAGTSGKNEGEWYPFFGYNNWLVKGSVGKKGEMEYSEKISQVQKLLNDNFRIPAKFFTQFGQITNGKGTPVNPDKVFYDISKHVKYESWFVDFDRQKDNKYTEEQFVADRTGLNPKNVVNDGKGSADSWIRDVVALTEDANTASKGIISNIQPTISTDARADIERRKKISYSLEPGSQSSYERNRFTFTYVRPFDYNELDNIRPVGQKAYIVDNYGEQKTFDSYAEGQKWLDSKYNAELAAKEGKAETTSTTDLFAKADSLEPIAQNFKDGDGGRKMQPQFAGKSTMDLIISGDRTRTTRAKTDIARMLKDYGLKNISELEGMVIRMTDKSGRQVYTKITKVTPFTQEYQDATWQKEGWVKEVTDKHVGNYPYAIEFEVVKDSSQQQVATTPNLSIAESEVKKEPHWKKDEAMANASTKAIAKFTTPKSATYKSSTKAYLAAIGGASTEFTNSDSVWVFGAGAWSATKENINSDFESYYKPAIDNALAAGVTTFNIGTATGIDSLATDYLKSKGFNVESQGSWNKLTTKAAKEAPIQEVKAQAINEATNQLFQRRGRTSADDPILNNFLNNKDFLNRYKNKLDKQTNIEATKEQIRLAKEWYAKSPLSKHIKLNIMFNAINTAVPNGVARWDVNGITLFKGSDFSDIYHEAWHGFTQMFLSEKERADLYSEARKTSGKFKSFDGKIIEFSKATDEQLEEYLAEDFREYMLGNGKKVLDKTPVKKNIFQKILDVLRYLFTGVSYQDGVTNGMSNPKIQELYNKLRVGDLTEYTFNQENAQFPGGLNKTKMDSIDPSNPRFLPQISAETSRLISTTVDALFSEAIDFLNRGNNTKAYTTAVIKTDEGRKTAYKYAEAALTNSLYNALLDRNEMYNQRLDTVAIDKEIDTLSWALANFGDTNDLSNPQGVIKFHMENSGLLEFEDRTTEVKDDSKLYQKNEFEAKSGNETAQKSLASPNLIYTLRSLNDYNKDGSVKLNSLGYPMLMDFNRAWNRMMNITEGSKTIDDIYNKLSAASVDYPVVAQFLSKIGAPSNMERSSQELWTEITKIFTMKRIPLVELHANVVQTRNEDRTISTAVTFTPSRAGGEFRKVGSKWDNFFRVAAPGPYITVTDDNVNTLNILAVTEDFPAVDMKNVFQFMEAIGMPLEDNPTVLKALQNTENGVMKAIKDLHRTITSKNGIVAYNNGDGISNPIIITAPSQLFAEYKVNTSNRSMNVTLSGRSKEFATIQKFHLAWSDDFSDTTVSNAEGENQYEKSLRSTVINQIDDINNAPTLTALTQEGVEDADDLSMNHLSPSRNPFMKTSLFMNKLFDKEGNKRVFSNEYGDRVEAAIELLNMSGASLTKQNVRGIIDESGIASANADETTKLLEDFYMMMLYGVSEATRHADKSTTYLYRLIQATKSKNKHLIQLNTFTENLDVDGRPISKGKEKFINILKGYLASEYERIQKVKEEEVAGNATVGKSTYAKEGAEFVIFDKILDEKTKEALKKFRSSSLAEPIITAEQFYKKLQDSPIRDKVEEQIGNYLTEQTKEFTQRLNEIGFYGNSNLTNPIIRTMLKDGEFFNSLSLERELDIMESIAEAYVANSWVQNYETVIMFYGDPGLYNHAKDEFFKRNAGVSATGTIPRTDLYMQDYINSRLSGISYANTKYGLTPKRFGTTMNSAVMGDAITKSVYYDEYLKAAQDTERKRLKELKASKKEIEQAMARIKKLFEPYEEMTEGDGQGWINFDAYRALLMSLNKWSPYQEELYAKIVNGEDVSIEEVYQFFPVKKMQYWGPLKTSGLPVYGFHKYSLMPLIPNVIENTNLETLQRKMLEQGIDYALLQSGSKINTLTKNGKADKFYNEANSNKDKTVAFADDNYEFTNNEIFLKYFKDQLEVHDHYSDKVTFSTQLRKLIEDGLMEHGVPTDWRLDIKSPEARIEAWDNATAEEKNESENYKKLIAYEGLLNRLVQLKKDKLKQEVGSDLSKLLNFVKKELSRQELAEHELDFVSEHGDLRYSIELSLSADKIEKMLVAVVQKRLINQKINGEALVQVSGVGFEKANTNLRNATEEEQKQYGTNGLKFYKKKADGTTSAMKIKIALQGSFKNLLELPEVVAATSDTVTPLQALNNLIQNEEWLNQGDNRQMVTMVAARIPVQGLNSMEFMEVFEFLPENAGNIVILPAEIVAKSGGDFDIDKMYTLMPNIKRQVKEIGKTAVEEISEMLGRKVGKKEILNAINLRENEFPLTEDDQKILDYVDNFSTEEVKIGLVKGDNVKAIENDLIRSSVDILSMESNFTSLITPNGTDIVKPIASDMAKTLRGDTGKVSPTEIFEIGRNLYKHQSNSIGKAVLGIIAVNNTFNTLFSRTGLVLDTFRTIAETEDGATFMRQTLRLPHNTVNGNISLSSLYTNEKLGTKISDVINQMINGAVDVAKDAWIFDIQGNKEIIPSLLFMIQAGVPVRQAVYFVSQPIIQDYIKSQRLLKSQFAQPIGLADAGMFYRIHARDAIVTDPNNAFTSDPQALYNKKGRVDKTKVFDLFDQWANIGENADLFTQDNLEKNLTNEGPYTDTDRAVFSHFLQIQEIANHITAVTQALKFDNDKTTTLFDARAKLAKVGELANGISEESIRKISEESPIAAFKIQDFILELYGDLFPLRDNPALVRAMESLYSKNDDGVTPIMSVKKLLGMDDEQFQRTFRNDFASFLFQNDYYKFDRNTKTYGTLNIEVSELENLVAAARVKEGKLYVDKKQIETLYNSKAYSSNRAWSSRMAPVPAYVFDMYNTPETKSVGLDLFTKFIYEREVIRTFAENSVENIEKTEEFKNYYASFKNEETDENRRYKSYESVLRDKALGNLNIPGYMFFGEKAYGKQILQLKAKYPQLFNTYAILNNLESFTRKYGSSDMTNLKFSNTLYTASDLNIYHENLLDLMNPSVQKVENGEENRKISELFQKLPIFAMLQSAGDTKSTYSLLRAMPPSVTVPLLEKGVNEYLDSTTDEKYHTLGRYFTKFKEQYDKGNYLKSKFKNFLIGKVLSTPTDPKQKKLINLAEEVETVDAVDQEEVNARVVNVNGVSVNLDELGINFQPNDQQIEALDKIAKFLTDEYDYDAEEVDNMYTLMGYAGTGKTSITKILLNYLDAIGKKVEVTATTHKAKGVIRNAIQRKVSTIHKALNLKPNIDISKPLDLSKLNMIQGDKDKLIVPDILVIDESSFIGDSLFKYIKRFAQDEGVKILFIGDPAQIKPVEETKDGVEVTSKKNSPVFETIDNYSELTKVERQATGNPLGPILDSLRSNLQATAEVFAHESNISGNEGIAFTDSGKEFMKNLIAAFKSDNFKKNKNFVRAITYINEPVKGSGASSVSTLNAAIREGLGFSQEYTPGEILMGYDNFNQKKDGSYAISNSADYVIVDSEYVSSKVLGSNLSDLGIDPVTVSGYNVTVQDLTDTSVKETIFIVDKTNDDAIFDQLAQTVEAIQAKSKAGGAEMWARYYYPFIRSFISSRAVKVGGRTVIKKGIDYGYAHTIHKSQGATYTNVFVDYGSINISKDVEERNQMRYVALSRATNIAYTYSGSTIGTPPSVDWNSSFGEQKVVAGRTTQVKLSAKTEEELLTLDTMAVMEDVKSGVKTFTYAKEKGAPAKGVLTEETAKLFAIDYPNAVPVYNETTTLDTNIAGTNTVWRETGLGIGIPTKKGARPTKADKTELLGKDALTDETIDENKKNIDNAIAQLLDAQAKGKILVFDANGYGQYMIGYNETTGQKLDGTPVAPDTFLYLSQQLFSNFGYVNPHYLDYVEGRREIQKTQPVTDDEILEQIKKCFSKK